MLCGSILGSVVVLRDIPEINGEFFPVAFCSVFLSVLVNFIIAIPFLSRIHQFATTRKGFAKRLIPVHALCRGILVISAKTICVVRSRGKRPLRCVTTTGRAPRRTIACAQAITRAPHVPSLRVMAPIN